MKPQPQFLRIRWEDTSEQGAAVTHERILWKRHCHSHSRRSQLGSPDGKPCTARPLSAPAEQ